MTTNTRTYPYKAWTVMPSGKPVEVELVKSASYWGDEECAWDRAASGKDYDSRKLCKTKVLAVIAALEAVDAQQEKLDKQQATLNKKRATLEKARIDS
jgi:hypothetical protein